MGAWNGEPWGNDKAAEFYAGLFEQSRLRDLAVEKLSEPVTGENHEQVRAAAAILLCLGRTFVWPIAFLDADLKLAIEKLTAVAETEVIKESPGTAAAIRSEIGILGARLDKRLTVDDSARQYWCSLV